MRGHKTEGQDLFYSVERDGQMQWYNRNAVILSLEQGNKLREQHSLGPYEPSVPLAKASDISLGKNTEIFFGGFEYLVCCYHRFSHKPVFPELFVFNN